MQGLVYTGMTDRNSEDPTTENLALCESLIFYFIF